MKKIGFLLCVVSALLFVGCGSGGDDKPKVTNDDLIGTWEYSHFDNEQDVTIYYQLTFNANGSGKHYIYAIDNDGVRYQVEEYTKPKDFKCTADEYAIVITEGSVFGLDAKTLPYLIEEENGKLTFFTNSFTIAGIYVKFVKK